MATLLSQPFLVRARGSSCPVTAPMNGNLGSCRDSPFPGNILDIRLSAGRRVLQLQITLRLGPTFSIVRIYQLRSSS